MNYSSRDIVNGAIQVRDKLATPSAWTKKFMALDKTGWSVLPNNPQACCWCLVGALHTLEPALAQAVGHLILYRNTHYDFGRDNECKIATVGLSEYNDAVTTTHEDIMLVLNTAIQMGELELTLAGK